jgi:hypothetical protein
MGRVRISPERYARTTDPADAVVRLRARQRKGRLAIRNDVFPGAPDWDRGAPVEPVGEVSASPSPVPTDRTDCGGP